MVVDKLIELHVIIVYVFQIVNRKESPLDGLCDPDQVIPRSAAYFRLYLEGFEQRWRSRRQPYGSKLAL